MNKIEDLTRHQIRYLCFRLQTEGEGGNKARKEDKGTMSFVDQVREHMEDQDEFGGWKNFAKTWDVDQKSPLVTIKRSNSIHSEWNRVLRKQAQNLPPQEPKKFLTNKLAEKVQTKKQAIGRTPSRDEDDLDV